MKESQSIFKFRELPKSQDFTFLRQMGLARIEKLASNLWTDYNLHDPGITILEVLCYAITDLGYRTHFNIQDILARRLDEKIKDFFTAAEILTCNPVTIIDFRKLIIDTEGIQNGWLHNTYNPPLPDIPQPAFYYQCSQADQSYEIRLNNPAIAGFEAKVLNGLYNVSLQLEEDDEFGDLNINVLDWKVNNVPVQLVFPAIEVEFPGWDYPLVNILEYNTVTLVDLTNYQNIDGKISFDLSFQFDSDVGKTISILGIKLLIDSSTGVAINFTEIETTFESTADDAFARFFTRRLKRIFTIIHDVYCVLHRHRNLCEDYVKFRIVRSQEIIICADIEVTPETDLEELLAQIYFEIDRFLVPPVRFYSLPEMLAKGKPVEEIFEGLVLEHGFIDTPELALSDLKTEIHVSDLYRIIMALDGVITVKNLLVTNYLDGVAQTEGDRWCVKLGGSFNLNLRTDKSKVTFYKDILPFQADKNQVERLVQTLKAADSKPKFKRLENDLPIPEGSYKDLKQYVSIQNDFPLVYGIGADGLPTTASELRKAQAKQLKAFLMFFDQLLANYLAQLDEAKNLLSINQTISLTRTYAIQPLYKQAGEPEQEDFPNVANLLKSFVVESLPSGTDLDNLPALQTQWDAFTTNVNNSYLQKLQEFSETEDQFLDRRNRFLDALIARFAEAFTDYAILMYDLTGKKSVTELIRDKEAFLASYPEISSERGKAFKYKCYAANGDTIWQEHNVSGLQKRLCKLLGIDDFTRRQLGYTETDILADFTITGSAGNFGFILTIGGTVVLRSSNNNYATEAEVKAAIQTVIDRAVDPKNYNIRRLNGTFDFDLQRQDDSMIATYGSAIATETLAKEKIQAIAAYIEAKYFREGMHIFEHILFRPVKDMAISQTDIDQGFFPECKLEQDCECPITDYYSFRITIVLPFWSLRFRNMDFRQYIERTIHTETPAHILPKICWVGVEAMNELEKRYREWLEEATKNIPDRNLLSDRIVALVKQLNTLTTVYPEGILHDCDNPISDDDIVILNRTQLGTFEDIEDETTE